MFTSDEQISSPSLVLKLKNCKCWINEFPRQNSWKEYSHPRVLMRRVLLTNESWSDVIKHIIRIIQKGLCQVQFWLYLMQPIWRDFELIQIRVYATSTFPIMHLICYSKFCITFVLHFFWVLQPSQEKFNTMLMQKFGGQIRCIMGNVELAYNLCLFGRDYLPEHSC